MFAWLRNRQRRKILEEPFPLDWRKNLVRDVDHFRCMDDKDRTRLEELVQVFAAEKNFEAHGGLTLTDEMIVLVSAQACLLILGLDHDLYRKVESILLYPSTVVRPERLFGQRGGGGRTARGPVPLLGEAHMGGPVILAWDAVKRGAYHPERGHNVVYHEFAHKLDMLDGVADGAPPLHSKEQYEAWARICTEEYERLVNRTNRGLRSFLDAYGATNPAEFFAVATEYFFDKPREMRRKHPELYGLLMGFYNQDTAAREKTYEQCKKDRSRS
jgi:Mlc titration factor MtfA (ptsG expression regulator)